MTASVGNQGVGSWIERRARLAPEQVAVIYGDTRYTYAELASRVRRLAHGLQSIGVGKGDRVGWLGPNHPAFLETLFASATLGAVTTPINYRLESGLINSIYADVAPVVLFVDRSLADWPLPPTVGARVVVGDTADSESEYEQFITEHGDGPIDVTIALDELCLLAFTSGTTSAPKGVMLSHANVTWNVINCLSCHDLRGDDVTIAAAPFFRTGGTGVTVLPVLFAGGTVVIPRRTAPEEIFHLIERHRVTIEFGNPDLLDALTQSPLWSTTDLTSLRAFVTGGAPVPERLLRTCHERHLTVLQGYGLSEAAPLVSVLDARNAESRAGSAGRPAFFVDLRIADADGTDSANGTIGELLVHGPNVATGYWQHPVATERAIDAGGWLRTGDGRASTRTGFCLSSAAWRTTTYRQAKWFTRASSSVCCFNMPPWPRRVCSEKTVGRWLTSLSRLGREPRSKVSCSRCAASSFLLTHVRRHSSSSPHFRRIPPARSCVTCCAAQPLQLHVGDTPLLDQPHGHDMRRHKMHAGIQPGDQVGAHFGDRLLPCLRELLRDVVERDVALPEDRAACLQRLHAERTVVHEDIPHRRLLRDRVDDLRALAKCVLLPEPVRGIGGKGAARNAHNRLDVGKLEFVDVAERVQVIPRKAEWRRLGCGIRFEHVEDLLMPGLQLIDPSQVPVLS